MADPALSAFLEVLFQNLASPLLQKFGLLWGLDKDLKKLSRKLTRIKFVLSDAEERRYKEEAVSIWLKELKGASLDAEDVIDEMATEVQRLELEHGFQVDQNLVRNFLFSSLKPNQVLFRLEISKRIKEIMARIDEIVKDKDDLNLRECVGRRIELRKRPQTGSLVSALHVFGRGDDREKLVLSLLSSDECNSRNVSVVAIVGMAGIGKTTVAQLVFNDERVNNHFELKMWVCVSDYFDATRIMKAVIESATNHMCDLLGMDPIQHHLVGLLSGRKYLLVLDDVWNDSYGDWDVLQVPLSIGKKGSKIVVTTRSEIVASIMGTVTPHCLACLSDADSVSLFRQRAFGEGNSNTDSKLLRIGMEIVKKCHGLPLALKTIGALLHSEVDENKWNSILRNEIWDLPVAENEILSNPRLSYHHLSACLKWCFAYCSIFPKNYELKKRDLVHFWMAEGFIQPKGGNQMEDIGSKYFEDLASRSFFQYSHVDTWDGQPIYKIHGLIHDLAQSLTVDECFRMAGDKTLTLSKTARHLTYTCSDRKPINFESFYGSKGLRTFVLLGKYKFHVEQIPLEMFLELRFVRVLDLSHTSITKLPDTISNLKHLRNLNLSWTRIRRLPEAMCKLRNLQTLKLIKCLELVELPKGLRNLVNLRHLDISYNTILLKVLPFADRRPLELPKDIRNLINLRDINISSTRLVQNFLPLIERGSRWNPLSRLLATPPGIGKLTSLQTLSNFVVGRERECKIRELRDMVNLRGALCIARMENVLDGKEAEEANLMSKELIHELTLRWSEDLLNSRCAQAEEEVINLIKPHPNLKALTVACYGGIEFPGWMRDPFLSSLETLHLYNCRKVNLLPHLGRLSSLKDLKLHGMHAVKQVGDEFCGNDAVAGFPLLQTLEFKDFPQLDEWQTRGRDDEFPCLHELTVWDCPKLKELPHLPPSLKILEIAKCRALTALPMYPPIQELVLGQCDEMVLNSLSHHTSSLSSLTIFHFPQLKSLSPELLQPMTRLTKLKILDCDELTSLPQLQHLSSLEYLEISSCLTFNTLHDEGLPTTLKTLRIVSCLNLMNLPKGLRDLNFLEVLEIWDCPQLGSLPEDGLPASLVLLWIRRCPLLEDRCRKGGLDWTKIEHVPKIRMDFEWISLT
ncbi:hypothetical protein MRB53_009025 [Persea americana]|uniref:Uncharacterized protein n=1 Tax=Persea americana TaxID=3435 RepID=A0ACC2LNF8_PERAE|nr:hypothetical protein MRB53_009025 [Persea americana]